MQQGQKLKLCIIFDSMCSVALIYAFFSGSFLKIREMNQSYAQDLFLEIFRKFIRFQELACLSLDFELFLRIEQLVFLKLNLFQMKIAVMVTSLTKKGKQKQVTWSYWGIKSRGIWKNWGLKQ